MPDILWSFKTDFQEAFKSTLDYAGVDYGSDGKLPKLEGILPEGLKKINPCKFCSKSIQGINSDLISCNAVCNICQNCTQGSSCRICNCEYSQMEKFVISQIPKSRPTTGSLSFPSCPPSIIENNSIPKRSQIFELPQKIKELPRAVNNCLLSTPRIPIKRK